MALEFAKRKPKDIVYADDLTVEWKDGVKTHYAFVALRDACPCAECVDEMSGQKIIDKNKIPKDIFIRSCEYVGNYAIRITWSDGHSSGIFPFRFLRDLSDLAEGKRPADAKLPS